ncbi:MAG: restriction endonuclease [Nanoarchaeota archaeon]
MTLSEKSEFVLGIKILATFFIVGFFLFSLANIIVGNPTAEIFRILVSSISLFVLFWLVPINSLPKGLFIITVLEFMLNQGMITIGAMTLVSGLLITGHEWYKKTQEIHAKIESDRIKREEKIEADRIRAEDDKIKQKELETEKLKNKKFEEKQTAKGLIKFKNNWGTLEQVKKWKEIDVGLEDNFQNISPYKFEEFIAKLFKKMGYSTTVTSPTGDFGADVLAKKDNKTTLIEVKRYGKGNLVTPKEVQRTLGAMWKHKADKAVFITTSDFTTRAKDLENESPIELWDKDILHKTVRKYFIENDVVKQ